MLFGVLHAGKLIETLDTNGVICPHIAMRSILISQIEEFAQRRGLAPATVTSRAVGNSRLYSRLRAGGDCTTTVAERLVRWMDQQEAAGADGDGAIGLPNRGQELGIDLRPEHFFPGIEGERAE